MRRKTIRPPLERPDLRAETDASERSGLAGAAVSTGIAFSRFRSVPFVAVAARYMCLLTPAARRRKLGSAFPFVSASLRRFRRRAPPPSIGKAESIDADQADHPKFQALRERRYRTRESGGLHRSERFRQDFRHAGAGPLGHGPETLEREALRKIHAGEATRRHRQPQGCPGDSRSERRLSLARTAHARCARGREAGSGRPMSGST